MAIQHIVAFNAPSPEKRALLVQGFLDLQKNCERDGRKYIKAITGGAQHSPEGKDHGVQVVFVMTFESTEDRDYYISHDTAHKAFGANCGPTYGVESAVVFDFTDGAY